MRPYPREREQQSDTGSIAPHAGGPVDWRIVGGVRTDGSAAITRMWPCSQVVQRLISPPATRRMIFANDSITTGTGAGWSSWVRQVASFAALWRVASKP